MHHDDCEITFKMMGLCFLYLKNWRSYPEFHLHAVLIDTVRYEYCGDVLNCADQ